MTFDPQDVMASKCPNLWHDLLGAGALVNGLIVVPDDAAQRILDGCRKIRGAGDLVAIIAQPIARAIDAVAGTNIVNCGGCAKRRQQLNEIIPV